MRISSSDCHSLTIQTDKDRMVKFNRSKLISQLPYFSCQLIRLVVGLFCKQLSHLLVKTQAVPQCCIVRQRSSCFSLQFLRPVFLIKHYELSHSSISWASHRTNSKAVPKFLIVKAKTQLSLEILSVVVLNQAGVLAPFGGARPVPKWCEDAYE